MDKTEPQLDDTFLAGVTVLEFVDELGEYCGRVLSGLGAEVIKVEPHLGWTVELEQQEIGSWPVKEFPVALSETPSCMVRIHDRSGPSYVQDNEYVLGRLLKLTPEQQDELKSSGRV